MRRSRAAFTLVELLVVIAIIATLVALLLPALAGVKENGRQVTCKNNLRQLGTGCQTHLSTHNHLPSGGWGSGWAGDPDISTGINQPGGWVYNVLPYIGQPELREEGKNKSVAIKKSLGAARVARSLGIVSCPSRGRTELFTGPSTNLYFNIDTPSSFARNDYAANGGDIPYCTTSEPKGPATIEEGRMRTDLVWSKQATCTESRWPTGVIYLRSQVTTTHPDGDTCTYLIGEKFLRADLYATGDSPTDQGWDVGYDTDVNRWTKGPPKQDNDYETNPNIFGGPHSTNYFAVFCDGHVRGVNYDIDPEIHRQLGNRKDGKPTDVSSLE